MARQPLASEGSPIAKGDSYYSVLEPTDMRDDAGNVQFGMVGPFAGLYEAQVYANPRPGAFIAVTLILHEVSAPAARPAASK